MADRSQTEMDRRSGKKMYEKVDNLLLEMMEDEEFTKEIFKEWAKNDPKGFFTIMKDRLPKVQPIDQDLQKTFISLKSMMEYLPEVEDVAKKLHNATNENNRLRARNEELEVLNKAYQNKLKEK
jgi:formiminotetrahydrofolate cyclodeaminase